MAWRIFPIPCSSFRHGMITVMLWPLYMARTGAAMMVDAMRWTALFLLPVLAGAAEIGGSNVRTVYVMPMAHGLDQYIANRLTARAHSGSSCGSRTRRRDFHRPSGRVAGIPAGKAASHAQAGRGSSRQRSDSDSDKDDSSASDKADKPASPKTYGDSGPPPASTFGHGKGTLFLVDAHSRVILWSMYEKPPNSSPGDLDRTAKRVVNRLKQDLAGK